MRLGIGHPGEKERVTGPRAAAISPRPRRRGWSRLLDAVADAAPLLAAGKPEEFMTRVALLARPEGAQAGRRCGLG